MREKRRRLQEALLFLGAAVLFGAMVWLLWAYVPRREVRYGLLGLCAGLFLLAALWRAWVRRQVADFADSLCDILDSLIAGEPDRWPQIYEDSLTAKVQGKLLQFYDIAREARRESQRDKQTIQELVSDISHQVKTPSGCAGHPHDHAHVHHSVHAGPEHEQKYGGDDLPPDRLRCPGLL